MGDELAVLGVSCCVAAGACYLVGWSCSKHAEFLTRIPRVKQLNELETKLLPLTVTICGRVGSDTPISCKVAGLRAVIREETAYKHFLRRVVVKTKTTKTTIKEERTQCFRTKEKQKQCNVDVSWNKRSAFMHSVVEEVPWYLDDGTGRVFVVGARRAFEFKPTFFQLTFGGEVFEHSKKSAEREKLDYDQGFKMLGVQRYEYILQTGTSLTILGEAVRETNGTIKIQKPRHGPFHISRQTIDQEISKFENQGRCFKKTSYWLASFGIILLLGTQDHQQC